MNSAQTNPAEMLAALLPELWYRRRLVITLFIIVALAILTAGWFWPKVYVSSAKVRIDNQNILKPLMEGTAVATAVESYTEHARQTIQSQASKQKLLNLLENEVVGMNEAEKDRFWEKVLTKLTVFGQGKDLIQFDYSADTPERA